MNIRISITLPDYVVTDLDVLAESRGVSRSILIAALVMGERYDQAEERIIEEQDPQVGPL